MKDRDEGKERGKEEGRKERREAGGNGSNVWKGRTKRWSYEREESKER